MVDHLSFSIKRSELVNRILIPKYYDPELDEANDLVKEKYYLPTLREVLLPGNEGSRLGTWIRREHYGTGGIPYIRTSDLNGWRLRRDFKKGVSSEIFKKVSPIQDVRAGDILMVAHGTYLVGTVAIVTDNDLPIVLQDHIFRLRVNPEFQQHNFTIDCWMLLAALSTRFVKRQIRARQFSADIIDKIGDRHLEVRVPFPKNDSDRAALSQEVKEIVKSQTEARMRLSRLLGSDLRMTRERSEARHSFPIMRSAIVNRILIPKYYDPTIKDKMI